MKEFMENKQIDYDLIFWQNQGEKITMSSLNRSGYHDLSEDGFECICRERF